MATETVTLEPESRLGSDCNEGEAHPNGAPLPGMSAAAGFPFMFVVAMPDDAMGEETPRGTGLCFRCIDGNQAPSVGTGVLIADHSGGLHVRMRMQGKPGQPWIAGARNEAYESFEMGRDNFRLVRALAYRERSTV